METRLSRMLLMKLLVSGARGRALVSIAAVVGSMCSMVPCWMVVLLMVLRSLKRLIVCLSGKSINRDLESS